MLELPSNDPTNPIKLADWLEISSVLSPDSDASRGDLESALRIASYYEISDSEEVERKILDVFHEIEQREIAAAHAYPFSVEGGIIKPKSSWVDYPVYTFCLFLSYFGPRESRDASKLFESISCEAAKNYIRGQSVGFGFPRTELPSGFSGAVTALCKIIGEGGQFQKQPVLDRKDDGLDVVAWADFVDKMPSKLLLFGQCAAGEDWDEKLSELQAERFCRQWMDSLVSPWPVRSFFIPHRVESNRWDYVARSAGIMFERCRLAYWAHGGDIDYAQYIDWVQQIVLQKASLSL